MDEAELMEARSSLLKAALDVVACDLITYSEATAERAEERLALAAKAYTEAIDSMTPDEQPLDWRPDLDKEMEEL